MSHPAVAAEVVFVLTGFQLPTATIAAAFAPLVTSFHTTDVSPAIGICLVASRNDGNGLSFNRNFTVIIRNVEISVVRIFETQNRNTLRGLQPCVNRFLISFLKRWCPFSKGFVSAVLISVIFSLKSGLCLL